MKIKNWIKLERYNAASTLLLANSSRTIFADGVDTFVNCEQVTANTLLPSSERKTIRERFSSLRTPSMNVKSATIFFLKTSHVYDNDHKKSYIISLMFTIIWIVKISLEGVFTPNTVSQQGEEIASLQAPHELHLRSKVTNFWDFRVAELPLLATLENTGFTNPDSWSNVSHTRIRTKFAPSEAGLRLNVKQNGNEKKLLAWRYFWWTQRRNWSASN